MKKVLINKLNLSNHSSVLDPVNLAQLFFIPKWLLIAILMFTGVTNNAYAAYEGSLGKSSNGSIQIILSVPETLNVYLSDVSYSKHNMTKTFCVLGKGITHYQLSVVNNEDGMTATDQINRVPFRIFSGKFKDEKIIPAANTKDKLILATERTCEQPLSLKIANSIKKQQNSNATYSGTTILSIDAE